MRLNGMVDLADRLRMGLRPEAGNLVEGEVGAGGDDQIIVDELGAVIEHDAVFAGMDAFGALRLEADPLLGEHRLQIDGDILALAPAHGDPWVGGHEGVGAAEIDDGEHVLAAELRLHLVGHDDATQAGAEHDDMCHFHLRSRPLARLSYASAHNIQIL